MNIKEIALKNYVLTDKVSAQSAMKGFLISSSDYLDELQVFLESIEFMLTGLEENDDDERIEIYFNKELSRIEQVIDDVHKNRSLVTGGAIVAESDTKYVEKNRVLVLMYLRSILNILCEHLYKQ